MTPLQSRPQKLGHFGGDDSKHNQFLECGTPRGIIHLLCFDVEFAHWLRQAPCLVLSGIPLQACTEPAQLHGPSQTELARSDQVHALAQLGYMDFGPGPSA